MSNSFLQYGFDSKVEAKPIMSEFLKMRHLVRFEGFQEIYNILFPMFTDRKTGTSFIVRKGEKLHDVWKSVRSKF